MWQAQSLVTTILPLGASVLSLPLKCVDYTAVDSEQKEDQISVILCLLHYFRKFQTEKKKLLML